MALFTISVLVSFNYDKNNKQASIKKLWNCTRGEKERAINSGEMPKIFSITCNLITADCQICEQHSKNEQRHKEKREKVRMPNSCKYIATIRSEKIGEEKRKETETCNASMFVPRLVRLVSFHLISCVALRLTSNTCKHTHTTAQCLSKLFVVFFSL